MKRFGTLLACSAILALAACYEPAELPAPNDPGDDTPSAAAIGVMQPGLYAVGDGTQVYARTRLNEDGTYVDMTVEGEDVGGGTWAQRGEEMCFDPAGDGEDQQERCWTQSEPDEDGGFMSIRTDGSERYRVTPLEE